MDLRGRTTHRASSIITLQTHNNNYFDPSHFKIPTTKPGVNYRFAGCYNKRTHVQYNSKPSQVHTTTTQSGPTTDCWPMLPPTQLQTPYQKLPIHNLLKCDHTLLWTSRFSHWRPSARVSPCVYSLLPCKTTEHHIPCHLQNTTLGSNSLIIKNCLSVHYPCVTLNQPKQCKWL